jgi:UDP-N-acetyl-D-glucosamine dehydrogenase
MRESPALTIMELLEGRGARVAYHNPYVPVVAASRRHGGLAGRRSVPLEPKAIAAFDAVLIVTDHSGIDY